MRKKSDEKLIIQLVANGNEQAFTHLFNKYYKYAFEITSMYCSLEDGEEIISDVFAKVWKVRENLYEIDNFKNYLFVLLRNACFNKLRYKKYNCENIEDFTTDLASGQMPVDDELHYNYLSKKVNSTIESLNPRWRRAFKLVKEDGLKYKQAAAEMSISVNTLEVYLKKAKKTILVSLKKCD